MHCREDSRAGTQETTPEQPPLQPAPYLGGFTHSFPLLNQSQECRDCSTGIRNLFGTTQISREGECASEAQNGGITYRNHCNFQEHQQQESQTHSHNQFTSGSKKQNLSNGDFQNEHKHCSCHQNGISGQTQSGPSGLCGYAV